MDSMRSPRFTVLNSDNDNIYISKSLLNKISQPPQQNQSQQQAPSENSGNSAAPEPAAPTMSASSAKRSSAGKADQHFTSDAFFNSDNAHTVPAYIDPEYIAKHAQYDPNTQLYALRGEYERRQQQYQQVWRNRFDELERLNEQLFKLNSEKFAKEVGRVDEKYFRRGRDALSGGGYDVPCKAAEGVVNNCLLVNGKKPLMCGDEVRKFSECVKQVRSKALAG